MTEPVTTTVAPTHPVKWGPLAAVLVTVVAYFMALFLGSILLASYASLNHWDTAYANTWLQQSVWGQFTYIAAVEAITIGTVGLFLRHRKSTFAAIGLIKPKLRDIGYAFVGFGMYFPILIATTLAVKQWFPQLNLEQKQQIGFSGATTPLQLSVVFISLVVLPPLAEEILFRGFLYTGLRTRIRILWSAVITSVVFGLLHLQLGNDAPPLWPAAIDTFILSLVLIYLREKTGGLWASIGLHMIKNGIAFAALFIFMR